jgi:diguanylate cyclase (GGDEF)-like protein
VVWRSAHSDRRQVEPAATSPSRSIAALCVLVAVGILMLDLWWPRGVAVAALYSLTTAIGILSQDWRVTRSTAALCAAFIVAGALLSPESRVPDWIVIVNAAIFAAVVGATAMLVMSRQRAALRLQEQRHLLERANLELARQAHQDGLTGIANRRAFDERLALEVAHANRGHQPLSLLMIDVDHFKRYNDAAGHAAGDACLKMLASALQGALRRTEDMVARYGGEEFAVLLPGTPQVGALDCAQRIRKAVGDLRVAHPGLGAEAAVTVSIGVHGASPPVSAAQLVQEADRMLYCAKAAGRDRAAGTP